MRLLCLIALFFSNLVFSADKALNKTEITLPLDATVTPASLNEQEDFSSEDSEDAATTID